MMGGGPMAPAGAEPAWTITGTIRLAPELEGKVGATDVLYVLARVAGQRMPLAVERVPAPAFPLAYTLSSGHAGGAAGGPPSALEVVARVSRAGTAGPAQPGDLEGTFDGQAAPGATGVDIVIGKQY
jgi:cytochrome c-type biogenesis protein CcmH